MQQDTKLTIKEKVEEIDKRITLLEQIVLQNGKAIIQMNKAFKLLTENVHTLSEGEQGLLQIIKTIKK